LKGEFEGILKQKVFEKIENVIKNEEELIVKWMQMRNIL
jgi:hypothetical protein